MRIGVEITILLNKISSSLPLVEYLIKAPQNGP